MEEGFILQVVKQLRQSCWPFMTVGNISEMVFKNRANQNVSSLTVPRLSVTGAVCFPLERDVFLTAYCHMTGGHLTREEDLF